MLHIAQSCATIHYPTATQDGDSVQRRQSHSHHQWTRCHSSYSCQLLSKTLNYLRNDAASSLDIGTVCTLTKQSAAAVSNRPIASYRIAMHDSTYVSLSTDLRRPQSFLAAGNKSGQTWFNFLLPYLPFLTRKLARFVPTTWNLKYLTENTSVQIQICRVMKLGL